ncbi:MAG TPA: hypothetical protein VN736_21800 [Candidatus Limnocylindrales bacterium]|nr:hypothetical protein [Candidatus Limnocylindrales bacterium]
MPTTRVILLGVFFSAALVAADSPFAGTWKMNPAKSNLTGTTITYKQLAGGEMEATLDGQSFKFKMDGKQYPDPFGDVAAWKAVDANTWQTDWTLNGKPLASDTLKLLADGKTLTVESKGTKPNGDKFDDTTVFQRVSGGPGLPGTWKTAKVNVGAPSVFEFVPSGANALTFKMVDMKMQCDTKVDGKDYPCSGPEVGPGWTLSLAKSADRAMDLVIKKDGKPFYKYSDTVSADGKTLTEIGGASATNEKMKIVFDKQ